VERYQKDAATVSLSNVLSLDVLLGSGDTDGYQIEVASPDDTSQPELALQEKELQEVLAKGISQLRKNEQIVLSLYYEHNLHLREIAQVLDLSEPRISQIHSKSLQKLRVYMDNYMNDVKNKTKSKRKGA
jgi:RNA polymerase sigma factor for flagellar operon FliA